MLEETGIMSGDNLNTTRTATIFAGQREGRQITNLEEIATTCAERSTYSIWSFFHIKIELKSDIGYFKHFHGQSRGGKATGMYERCEWCDEYK